jgi:hypothetical protein
MASGPLLPSSIYLGAASGNLSPTIFQSSTAGNNASFIEGIGCVASLGSTAPCTLQFNLPESIPTGTMKLRGLAWAQATTGKGVVVPSDGQTAVNSDIGGTALTANATMTWDWASLGLGSVMLEQKVNLSTTPTANDILTVLLNFESSAWTLAATGVFQFSLVWEP